MTQRGYIFLRPANLGNSLTTKAPAAGPGKAPPKITLIKDTLRLFMPDSQMASIVGGVADLVLTMGIPILKKFFPVAGLIVEDAALFIQQFEHPLVVLLESACKGACLYLPTPIATDIVNSIKSGSGWAADAADDVLRAIQFRTSRSAPAMASFIDYLLDAFDVGDTVYRVAFRVYTMAIAGGAQEYQASAAFCYTCAAGLKVPTLYVPFVADAGPAAVALPGDDFRLHAAQVSGDGTYPASDESALPWIREQWNAQQSMLGLTTRGGASGMILPALAIAAVAAYLLTRRGKA